MAGLMRSETYARGEARCHGSLRRHGWKRAGKKATGLTKRVTHHEAIVVMDDYDLGGVRSMNGSPEQRNVSHFITIRMRVSYVLAENNNWRVCMPVCPKSHIITPSVPLPTTALSGHIAIRLPPLLAVSISLTTPISTIATRTSSRTTSARHVPINARRTTTAVSSRRPIAIRRSSRRPRALAIASARRRFAPAMRLSAATARACC